MILGRVILGLLITQGAQAQINSFTLSDWAATAEAVKPMYAKAIMEQAGIHKVRFEQPAEFYVQALNEFAQLAQTHNYRPYLTTSAAQNLATLAVIHCDWHNGVEPWTFAQGYLGSEQIALLQRHYPEAIAKLQNNCE